MQINWAFGINSSSSCPGNNFVCCLADHCMRSKIAQVHFMMGSWCSYACDVIWTNELGIINPVEVLTSFMMHTSVVSSW